MEGVWGPPVLGNIGGPYMRRRVNSRSPWQNGALPAPPASSHPLYQRWRYAKLHDLLCPAWAAEPWPLIEWAVTHGWQQGLTVQRLDRDRPFGPDNARIMDRHDANRWANVRPNQRCVAKAVTDGIHTWPSIRVAARKLGREYMTVRGWAANRRHGFRFV
jgi:hypothetical protein